MKISYGFYILVADVLFPEIYPKLEFLPANIKFSQEKVGQH
jgi:hypothetical protein